MSHGKAEDFDLDSHDLGISAHRSDPIDRYLLRASPSHTQARLCHLPPPGNAPPGPVNRGKQAVPSLRCFVEAGDWSTLFIDAVDLSQAHPRLVGTETIEFERLADRPCSGLTARASETVDTTTDCRLLQLVERFAAEPAPAQRAPRPDL